MFLGSSCLCTSTVSCYTYVILTKLRTRCSQILFYRDDVLPDGTFVPAGATVSWMPFLMGRSEETWGKDALEFKPERFLDKKEPSMFRHPVFNAGPRTCLGKSLALSTMKMTLAYLLPKFDFKDSLGHSGAYRWTLVRSMKGGFVVDVSEKENK